MQRQRANVLFSHSGNLFIETAISANTQLMCVHERQKDKRKSAGVRKHKYPCKHTNTLDHIIMYKISMLLPVCDVHIFTPTDQHMHCKILYLNAIASRMDKKLQNSYEIP